MLRWLVSIEIMYLALTWRLHNGKWLLMKNLRNQNGNDPGKIITFSSYSLVQNRWVLSLAHRQTDGFAASVTCSGDFRMSLVAFLCSIRGRRRVTSMNNTLFTPKFKHVFWKLSCETRLKPMFFDIKCSTLSLQVSRYLNPMENSVFSVLCFW